MHLEKQVCSLQLSKELKKAGYKQEGLWWWKQDIGAVTENIYAPYLVYFNSRYMMSKGIILYVAPTVAEMGEALPDNTLSYHFNKCYICVCREEDNSNIAQESAKSEADARAKMYLLLKKEGLL